MPSLLVLENLCVAFPGQGEMLFAVNNLGFALEKGQTSCLVGESGCGKSLTCRAILRLEPENAILGGQVRLAGENLLELPEKDMLKIRGKRIGMIFQEPMTSLNPVLTVGEQTAEPLRIHLGMGRKEARQKVLELFTQVGIPSPETRYSAYPHQLSGGMRQRVMIAMSLACDPEILLADEPTTALDVTVQGQILRLIGRQTRERDMAVLLITHDLGVVADMADAVGVMYAGHLVEHAPASLFFAKPLHPYSRGLLRCAPTRASAGQKKLPIISGVVPALDAMPEGCAFQPRCPKALPICAEQSPPAVYIGQHKVACWLYSSRF